MIQEVADLTQVKIPLANDVYLIGSQLEQIKEGEFYYVFPDGTKQYAGIYANDKKQGIWQDYKGDQLFTSIYEKGIRNPFLGTIDQQGNRQGFWTEIDGEDDQLIYQGDYKNNIRVGTWKVYNYGKLVGKGDYNEHGIKVGEWFEPCYKFTARRHVFYFGEYQNGQKIGYWSTNYNGEQVGGGYYNQYGLKEGDWTELYRTYHYDGKMIQKGAYLNGLPIGQWKIIDKNRVIGGGNYIEQGVKHGKWTEFQIYKKFQGEYNRGLRIGEWEIKINNQNSYIYNYNLQGQKQGTWIEVDSHDSCITYRGEYNCDLRIGEWKTFSYNRIIGGGIYDQNGLKQDRWIEKCLFSYSESGKYKNGIRIGEWLYKRYDTINGGGYYDEQGLKQGKWTEQIFDNIIEQGIYKNGIRQGKWETKVRNDNMLFEGHYDEKGIKQGRWDDMKTKNTTHKCYISCKRLIESGNYINGIRTGKWKGTYDNIIMLDGEYDQNGVKQGLWKDPYNFFIDFFGTSFGQYNNGLCVGEWSIIDEDGDIIGNCNYNEKGALDGVVNFDKKEQNWQYFYENGLLNKVKISTQSQLKQKIEGCFNWRNQKDGMWIDKFKKKQFLGQYRDGKKIGLFLVISDLGKKISKINYDLNGLKQGDSIEPSDNYDEQNEITYHRFYQNDIRVGNCKIMFDGYQIGGGNYDNDGNKQGIWKKTKDIYNYSRQIIFQGEYKDNIRVGQWIILFKGRKIGGGIYDEKGLEQGMWHEVDSSFDNWNQKIGSGIYKNGKKIGEWIIYENGVIYDKKIFDDEGNLVEE